MESANNYIHQMLSDNAVVIVGKYYWSDSILSAVFDISSDEIDRVIQELITRAGKYHRTKDEVYIEMSATGMSGTMPSSNRYLTLLGCRYLFSIPGISTSKITDAQKYFFSESLREGKESVTGIDEFLKNEELRHRNLKLLEHHRELASDRYIYQMNRLQRAIDDPSSLSFTDSHVIEGLRRDDSFMKNNKMVADNHRIIYKLGLPLWDNNNEMLYEFLIEYDIFEPCTGIYYGCKMLSRYGNHEKHIETAMRQWEELKELTVTILNDTFIGKDFGSKLLPTDNANDDTFWPFWIRLDNDEDIIRVAVRSIGIIRRIYHAQSFCLQEPYCSLASFNAVNDNQKKAKSKYPIPKPPKTLYTYETLEEGLKGFGGTSVFDKFKAFMTLLCKEKIISESHYYEFMYPIEATKRYKLLQYLSAFYGIITGEGSFPVDYCSQLAKIFTIENSTINNTASKIRDMIYKVNEEKPNRKIELLINNSLKSLTLGKTNRQP